MGLLSLHTWLGPGWEDLCVGYYMHEGHVYISGAITNEAEVREPPITNTILHGLPAALRPTAPVKIVLPIWPQGTDDPRNPALQFPRSLNSTVYPNGLWLFDYLPVQARVTPSGERWYYYSRVKKEVVPNYHKPLFLTVILGNARWPVHPLSDTYATTSVPIGEVHTADFSAPVDYVHHNTRIHLAGSTTRQHDDGPETAFLLKAASEVPAGLLPSLLPAPEDPPYLADWTTGETDEGAVQVPFEIQRVSTSGLTVVESGDVMAPSGHDLPLSASSGFNSVPDWNNAGKHTNILATGLAEGANQKRKYATKIVCVTSKGGKTEVSECPATVPMPIIHLYPRKLFAETYPLADWAIMSLRFEIGPWQIGFVCGAHGCEFPAVEIPGGLGPGPWDPTLFGSSWMVLPTSSNTEGSGFWYLLPPAALFRGDPWLDGATLPFPYGSEIMGKKYEPSEATPLLWKPEQLPEVLALVWSPEAFQKVEVLASLVMKPYYNIRQYGLRGGDVVDLKRAGWASIGTAPPPGLTVIGDTSRAKVERPVR